MPPELFDWLVKLEVQLDPNFSRGDFVQQQPAFCGAFALHLFLYGCHGNLGTPEEILKRQKRLKLSDSKTGRGLVLRCAALRPTHRLARTGLSQTR